MDVAQSGSTLSNAEADALQTITLGQAVVQLVREPAALLYQHVQKAQKLRRSLGEWEKKAYINKQLHIPQLLKSNFENYLIEQDGLCQPKGPPKASTSWDYLLYAIGIEPSMEVVQWRPLVDGLVDTQDGKIEMELDGSVMCHIINLYQLEPLSRPKKGAVMRRVEDTKECQLSFGRLAWGEVNGRIHARFQPGTLSHMAQLRMPFDELGQMMEPNTRLLAYLNALEFGISDTTFAFPDPTRPLKERVVPLIRFLRWFAQAQIGHVSRKRPILMTYEWLDQASRVKRRLLTGGGQDTWLYDACSRFVATHPAAQKISDRAQRDYMVSVTLARVRSHFLWSAQKYELVVPNFGVSPPMRSSLLLEPRDVMSVVLSGFAQQPVGSREHELFSLQDDVLTIYTSSQEFELNWSTAQYIGILDLTSTSDLWSKNVLLG